MTGGMITALFPLAQGVLVLLLAPLLQGWIKMVKARLQGRKGPPLLQPYRDLAKYMAKGQVRSRHSSWIFRVTPYAVFGSTFVAATLLPSALVPQAAGFSGDLFLFIYLFAFGRFFLALAGLDAGSSFGGMGSSREMFVSSLAEPALLLGSLALVLDAGSTRLASVTAAVQASGWEWLTSSHLLAFAALLIIVIAETGRVPVDNPDTHLELTMIHEGMLLEYSGSALGLLHWSAWTKQWLLLNFLLNLIVPGQGPGIESLTSLFLLLTGFGVVLAFVESFFAKVRIFRVPSLMGSSFMLGFLALLVRSVH